MAAQRSRRSIFSIAAISKALQCLAQIVVFNLGDPVAIGKKIQAVGVRFATRTEIEQANYARSFGAGVNALASGTGAQ